MARTRQDVTATELAILQVLWERGATTRRHISDVLYPGGGSAHYTTVQKLLERLEEKEYVHKERTGSGLRFTATVGREELISRRLLDVAEKLCGGSLTPLLINLVRARSLTAAELQELQELIDDLGRQNRRKGGKR